MLSALSPEEAEFYRTESNVVDQSQYSSTIFLELQEQYGFVGGTESEYIRYFHRTNMDQSMWTWGLGSEVRAITGFSTVAKKDPLKQRKLLMQCATNYAWVSGKTREHHGMYGGTALSSLHSPSDEWSVSAFDESHGSRVCLLLNGCGIGPLHHR